MPIHSREISVPGICYYKGMHIWYTKDSLHKMCILFLKKYINELSLFYLTSLTEVKNVFFWFCPYQLPRSWPAWNWKVFHGNASWNRTEGLQEGCPGTCLQYSSVFYRTVGAPKYRHSYISTILACHISHLIIRTW